MQEIELSKKTEGQLLPDKSNGLSSRSLRNARVVDISFKNIVYQVTPKGGAKRDILKNLNGFCPGGEVTAILGSSGAGKTSLLNILASRVSSVGGVTLTGSTIANGIEYDSNRFSQFASYVMQNDVLLETLTPREAFQFVADLKYLDVELRKRRVEDTIKTMKLDRCQHSPIGGMTFKGISGGERKRASIGFELVSNPSCILLDEPTSGLDSFTAFQIINELRNLAFHQDRTIIFTIHQPSSDIFQLFDRIMLLVQGQFIYQGPRTEIIKHFKSFGFACPDKSNPIDYLLSIMHTDDPANQANFPIFFENYFKKISYVVLDEIEKTSRTDIIAKQVETSTAYQISKIAGRAMRHFMRDKLALRARILMAIFMGLIVGGSFYGVAENNGTFNDLSGVSGAMFLLCMNLTFGTLQSTILQFSVERDVFLREENSKLYTTLSYFIGKSFIELPFCIITPLIQELILYWMIGLNAIKGEYVVIHIFVAVLVCFSGNSLGLMAGCAFQDIKAATSMVPMILMPLVLFSGFFANSDTFFSWIGWVQWLSPFKYAFEAFSINEYEDRYYEIDPIDHFKFTFGLWESIGMLLVFFVVARIGAFYFLYSLRSSLQ